MPFEHDGQEVDARALALVRAEADIARARQQVALSITDLQRQIARTVDWREWVRRKPGLTIGVAFGLGLLFGRRK